MGLRDLFPKKKVWVIPPFSELRKRARILVIDDQDFIYKGLFERDGYTIEKWDDVQDLQKVEDNHYDIILLDLQGVGKTFSDEEGLGLLKYIKEKAPAQIIIAYSHAEWRLKYQDFFDLANHKLDKDDDYYRFKKIVDEYIIKRFSPDYYVDIIVKILTTEKCVNKQLRSKVHAAINELNTDKLRKIVQKNDFDTSTLEKCISVANLAVGVAQICMTFV